MRIAFISQWFDPEGGSAAIPGAMVRALEDLGHDLHVVTGYPNYPTGNLQNGYRVRPLTREMRGKTHVSRVALYPSHDRSPLRRILNFLSFMASASTIGAFVARRSKVALVYSTPATVGLAGVVLRSVFRRPFVLYIQDMWPDTVIATGMVPERLASVIRPPLASFCNLVYRRAGRIAVISPGMKQMLIHRGVPEPKIDVIYNWVDEALFHPERQTLDPDAFTVMYAGNVGDVQGLETLVHAVSELGDLPDLRVKVVGEGVARDRLISLCRDVGVEKQFDFVGAHPVSEMSRLMATADVQLVSLRDLPLFHATMPSKVQAILACGQPVIVSAPGDAAELVRESGAGIVAAPEDPGALALAIRGAYALRGEGLLEMGRSGHAFYEAELCAAIGAARLETSLLLALDGGKN